MSNSPSSPGPSSSVVSIPPFSTTSLSRLQALYSDFSRQKHSNPTSYNANVQWWKSALQTFTSSGLQDGPGNSRLILSANSRLMERLKVNKAGKPLALGAVLSELRTSKHVILLSDFLNAKVSIYDAGWLPARIAAYVIGRPLWWTLEQMGIVGEEGILSPSKQQYRGTSWWGEYVFVELLEKAADAIIERQRDRMVGPGSALYTWEDFKSGFKGVLGGDEPLQDADMKVLVKYMERDRDVIVVDKELIKFIIDDASDETRTITSIDRGMLELKTAVRNLHAQVDSIHDRMDECTRKASTALQQKRKELALSYIRSRKQLGDVLTKRLGSLNTLESTLITVEAAAGDVDIMKSYESSTTTLRSILAHPSLHRDSISKTMDALAEANDEAHDIDNAVRIGGDIAVGVHEGADDADIEAELEALIRETEIGQASKESEIMRSRLEEDGLQVPSKIIPGEKSPSKKEEIPLAI